MRRARVPMFMFLATVSLATSARAADAPPQASAEKLFEDGRAALGAGRLEEACAMLADSLKLDPGIGTMLYLGECLERSGRTASAWAQFREAQATAARTKDGREKIARARADKLEPRLSRLEVDVPEALAADEPTITRDGTPLEGTEWGKPVPVDPGEHVVRVEARGRQPFEARVEVKGEGATERVEIPALAAERAEAPPPVEPEEPVATEGGGGLPTARWVALGLGGLALASAGLGTYFGLSAMDTMSEAEGHCDARYCDAAGLALRDDATTQGNLSTLGFVVSGLAAAGGVALWVLAPQLEPKSGVVVSPVAGPGGASLMALGRF